jgi:hypothetical protein
LFADLVGAELGLSRHDRQLLQWAALIHDLGKLSVPPAILNKRGRPDADEWSILQGHPMAGELLVAPLRPLLGDWADAVGGHHEKWDGSGYPRGLAGEEISRPAAIVAVADSFEVMTAVRSYKRAMSMEDARAELTRCAGSHFSPEVVRAFLSISLGRLRVAMGPLSALAHLPFIRVVADLPAGVAGTLGSAGTRVAAVMPGVVAGVAAGAMAVTLTAPAGVESARLEMASAQVPGGGGTFGAVGTGPGARSGTADAGSASGGRADDRTRVSTDDDGSGTTGDDDSVGVSHPDEGVDGELSTESSAEGADVTTSASPRAGGGTTRRRDADPTSPAGSDGASTDPSDGPSPESGTPGDTTGGGWSAPADPADPVGEVPPQSPSGVVPTAPTTTAPVLQLVGNLQIMVSTRSDRSNAVPLAGATFAAGTNVYVFVQDPSLTGVQFFLGAGSTGLPFSTDLIAPYDLRAGDGVVGGLLGGLLPGPPKPYTIPATRGVQWITGVALLGSTPIRTGSAPFLVK